MTPPPPASREDQRLKPGPQDGDRIGPARFQSPIGPDATPRHSPLRAAGAGFALALLVVGVPLALIWLAGPLSWPGSLPGRDDLTGSIGIEQVLAVLLVVAGLAWAQFTICVVVEVIAARRGGVLARPVPFSGPSQRLARTLVASVLVASTIAIQSGTAFAATGPAPSASLASSAARTVATASSTPGAANPADARADSSQAVFAPGGIVPSAGDASRAGRASDASSTSGADGVSGSGGVSGADGASASGQAGGTTSTDVAQSRAASADDPQSGQAATDLGRVDLVAAPTAADTYTAIAEDDAEFHGRKVYVVDPPAGRHHDSLWAIAEEHLGDGRRYKEIYALNHGREQPDGRTLHLARLIQPGWRLIMPEDATGVPRYLSAAPQRHSAPGPTGSAGSGSAGSGGATSTVRAGSGVSSAATDDPATRAPAQPPTPAAVARHSPSAARAAATPAAASPAAASPAAASPAAASPAATAPAAAPSAAVPSAAAPSADPKSGTTSAAATPAATAAAGASASGAAAGATSAAATARPVPAPAAATAQPAPATAAAPAPGTAQQPGATTAARSGSGSASQPSQQPNQQPRQPDADRSSIIGWPGAEILGAGLLGAGMLAALLLVRRRRGGVTPEDPAAEAEVWLRAGADADRGALLDRALRTIIGLCAGAGAPLPQVYGAVVDNEGIDLLLSVPQPGAPYPWRDAAHGHRWRLRIEDGDELGEPGESAYPLLASVGRDDQGRDALINLGAAGGPVTVLGSPAMASAVVRALALSLAGNPWSRGIEVLTCDLPETLPAIAAGRLIACDSADDLTGQLEDADGSHLVRSGPARVLTGGPAPGSRPERVAVYGAALPGPVARRVEGLARTSGSELAVLMTGELTAARWRLRVDDTGRLTCDELSLAVSAHRLGDGSIERLHSLFTSAAQPPARGPQAPGTPAALAGPLLEADDIAWAQASARIAILGDVEVRADGPIDPARIELASEMVTYLALHPAGAHPTVLGSAIWPRGVTADVRDQTIDQVRAWMGTDPDGHHRVRTGHDGRVRLSPNVVVDWDVLRTLLSRARTAPAISRERDLLVRALHLVRGPVAGGPTAGAYSWIARLDLEQPAEDLIIDAAGRLSQLCADERDHVGVAQAAAAGLRARPDAQELWRHILRAEHALGGTARLAAVVEHMRDALDDEGVDLEPQSQALIDHLMTPTGSFPASQPHPAS